MGYNYLGNNKIFLSIDNIFGGVHACAFIEETPHIWKHQNIEKHKIIGSSA